MRGCHVRMAHGLAGAADMPLQRRQLLTQHGAVDQAATFGQKDRQGAQTFSPGLVARGSSS